MKRYFVYKTTNIINNKIYIGVHSTDNINDGYIGNGISNQKDADCRREKTGLIGAVKKYKYVNFKTLVLKYFNNQDDAFEYEKELVTLNFIKSKNTYNLCLGGNGGYKLSSYTKDEMDKYKKKLSEGAFRARNQGKGLKEHTQKSKDLISEKTKLGMKKVLNDPNYKKNHSDGTKKSWEHRSHMTKVTIDGIDYPSIISASRKLNIERHIIKQLAGLN